MATLMQSGTRYCGPYFYEARDTDWNLVGNNGARTWDTGITFPIVFTSTPAVNVFLIAFHLMAGSPHRLGVGVANVTTTSFQLQINTWDDTQVAGVGVGWIAYTL